MMKRKILLILLAALFLVSLFGCAPSPSGQTPAPMVELQTVPPAPETEPPETEPPETEPPETEPPTVILPTAPPAPTETPKPTEAPKPTEPLLDEDESYDTKELVALYIHTYGHLPPNFVTKRTARAAGWNGGALEPYFPGCSIGGDTFLNREGQLPRAKGRTYYECDIGTTGRKSRGAKRIIYSNDGLIYYTGDHYESFTLLYGEAEP